jgi:hypothetical protein
MRTLTLPFASSHMQSPSSPSRQIVAPLANYRRVKIVCSGSRSHGAMPATGAAMHMTSYSDDLREKYGALYRLPTGSAHWGRP